MEKDIPLKTSIEVKNIKKSCRIVEETLYELREIIRPGITTLDINRFCDERISRFKGEQALKGYRGYPASVCTSVNQVACHGIPSQYRLVEGDLVTVDITVGFEGWYGDSAWSYLAGKSSKDAKRLLKAAWNSTIAGIGAARAGNRMGDIGFAVESTAGKYGCRIMDKFVGHGIGLDIHEEPIVLHSGEADTGQPIVPGMVFTIEPILTLGEDGSKVLDDGWSIVTVDGNLTAQFEHTVAVFGQRTDVLTMSRWEKFPDGGLPPYY